MVIEGESALSKRGIGDVGVDWRGKQSAHNAGRGRSMHIRVYRKKIILHFDDALGKKGCESWQRTSVIFFRFFG